MTTDFARRNYQQPKKRRFPARTWLSMLVVLAVLGLALAWYRHHALHPSLQVAKAPSKHAIAIPAPVLPSAPTFEFYTILPNGSVDDTRTALRAAPAASPVELPVAKAMIASQFVLQVAAVHDFTAADQLNSELDLLGYKVIVSKSGAGNAATYRVAVGPYPNQAAALAAQQRLQAQHITSILKTQ